MDTIPDKPLVHIFSYLKSVELIGRVRGVCRRWRKLALCDEAWEHRDIYADSKGKKKFMMVQALKLVPCVNKFDACSDDLKNVPELTRLASTTSCAARHLDIRVIPDSSGVVLAIMQNQVRLGRLRRLTMDFYCAPDEAWRVLDLVGDLHLDELQLSWSCVLEPNEVLPDLPKWGCGSVKALHFPGVDLNDELLWAFITARAATVEEVGFCQATRSDFNVPALSALGECPKLRKVSLPAVLQASSLLKCPALTSLHINVGISPFGPFPKTLTPALRALFEGATGLTDLSLVCMPLRPKTCTMAVVMLACLASSGKSRLETLSVGLLTDVDPPAPDSLEGIMGGSSSHWLRSKPDCALLNGLPAGLKGLPKLRTLRLANCPTVKTLDAIEAPAAPSLLRLEVDGGFVCHPLTTQHVEALARLVARVPGLHVEVRCSNGCKKARCRQVLGPKCGLGFFSHPEGQACKRHTVGLEWRAVPPAE